MNYESLLLAQVNAHIVWLTEEGIVPQIVINTTYPGLEVPEHLMRSPSLILKIGFKSVENFYASEAGLGFKARFNMISHDCFIPLRAIGAFLAIGDNNFRMMLALPEYPPSDNAVPVAPPAAEAAPSQVGPPTDMEGVDNSAGTVVAFDFSKRKK